MLVIATMPKGKPLGKDELLMEFFQENSKK
jgi:hypothetical protein